MLENAPVLFSVFEFNWEKGFSRIIAKLEIVPHLPRKLTGVY